MRHIGSRGDPPPALVAAQPAAVAAAAHAVVTGTEPIAFRTYVYASSQVRTALTAVQHGKCAYCEVRILPVSTPHVEHFRPKAGYVDEATGALTKPGYYWLAYTWDNLALSCPSCNGQSRKGNRFPLLDESKRASGPGVDVSLEEPLLIDPFSEDPQLLIGFNRGVAYAVGGDLRARTTIDVLDLNREDLVDAREDELRRLFRLVAAVAELAAGPARTGLEAELARMMSESGSFYACLHTVVAGIVV